MSGREQFIADYGISRAQLERFDLYARLLVDAQSRMNLVATSTLPELWTRHMADSAQLMTLGAPDAAWLDLGSGAGFPGIVLAILGADVDMVEAVGKKAAFLKETIDALGLSERARVHHTRVESLAPWPAGVIVARAFAPLSALFDYGIDFAARTTWWILPKGARVEAELSNAAAKFEFQYELVPSRTSSMGRIIVACEVRRRGRRAVRGS